jgi:hypothetical protein
VRRNAVLVLALATGLLAGLVYLRTLYPGVGGGGDAIKFQYLGRVLGTAHTPGYPLYVMVSHAFSYVPIGSIAYRMNAMSALFAAITVALACLILIRLRCRPWIAASAALALAFDQALWSKAVGAEVYTFSAMFAALNVWLALRWAESGRPRDLYVLAAVFGLGLGNHLSAAMILPGIVAFVLAVRPSAVRPKPVLVCALLVLAAMLQYGFILLRTWQEATFVEARATNLRELYDVLRATPYADSIFTFTARQILEERVPILWRAMVSEFGPLGVLFLGLGAVTMVARRMAAGWLLLVGAGGFVFLALNVDADFEGFLLAAFVLGWLVAGIGMEGTVAWLGTRPRLVPVAAAAVVVLPVWQFQAHYRVNDHHGRTFETRYLEALFEILEPKSAIVREAYSVDQMVLYKLAAEDGAAGRTIYLIPADAPTVQRHFGEGFTIYAFGNTRAVMEGHGLGFEPVQLFEPAVAGRADRMPFDMTPLPLFRAERRAECRSVGNEGWRDVTTIPTGGRLVLRVDNYRPFDSEAVLYVGTKEEGTPALVLAQGPGEPVVDVRTFRAAVPADAAALSALLAQEAVVDRERFGPSPLVHRIRLRVNDQGQSETAMLHLGGHPDVAYLRVSVDLNNPLRASACGWAGRDLLRGKPEDRVPIGEDGRALFGRGWGDFEATSIGDVRWTSAGAADVLLPLGAALPGMIALRAKPFGDPGVFPRHLTLTMNGRALEGQALRAGWQDYQWAVPEGALRPGFNQLTLRVTLDEGAGRSGEILTVGLQALTLKQGG